MGFRILGVSHASCQVSGAAAISAARAITDIHSRHGVGEDPSKEFILSDSRRTAERHVF